ncbi:P2 family phage major capsid protein [Alkalicoccobacillus gibsonii]|uniref:P2 family phage major capsid protein n=1 Tax=Alkalicoccobacillus gibsonii TaxID=79881 RepID=UPI00235F0FB0|nr:P2 family phage major capsid protein [Alkalicoccobacillus gibsonii]
MPTNRDLMKEGTLTTGGISSGLLQPEQASQFLQQTFEATALGNVIRKETRRARTGEIDKIGIDSRILRKKVEDTDDGYRKKPKFAKVEYATKAVRLPWEITEESLRENIEGEQLEGKITNLMTTQLGIDLEDLYLNGDEDIEEGTEDYDFLKINNGWLKQLQNDSHVVDRSQVNAGAVNLDVFYSALAAMPDKFNNGTLRWLAAPSFIQKWEQYLLTQSISNGGGISDSIMKAPGSTPFIPVPRMPADSMILTNPKNLIVVNTYDMRIRKTTEGQEAIMKDKRFYVVHLDYDNIIEEKDAAVLITGLK